MMRLVSLSSIEFIRETDHSRFLQAWYPLVFVTRSDSLLQVKERAFTTVVLNCQFPLSGFASNVKRRLELDSYECKYESGCFLSSRFWIERAVPGRLPKVEWNKYWRECNPCSLRCWVGYSLPCEGGRFQPVFSCRNILRGSSAGTPQSLFLKISKTSLTYCKSQYDHAEKCSATH